MRIQTSVEERTRKLGLAQGAYYVASGAWPILHLRSFESITGKKPEPWLVKTVGALVTVVGATVALASRNRRLTPEVKFLAGWVAIALAAVDVVYPLKRRISPVYLADAVPELLIALGWWLSAREENAKPSRRLGAGATALSSLQLARPLF